MPEAHPEWLEGGGLLDRYRARPLPPVAFSDSPRLNSLIRGGNIYLSLRDAIALAIENNLDVELHRVTALIAETDLLRAKAGETLRSVSVSVNPGPEGLGSGPQQSQVEGISGTAGSQTSTDVPTAQLHSAATSATHAVSNSTGPAVPSLNSAVVGSIGWSRSDRPQTNTFITGTP